MSFKDLDGLHGIDFGSVGVGCHGSATPRGPEECWALRFGDAVGQA